MKPCQPGGGVESPLAKLLEGMTLEGNFYKYHYAPKDGPFNFPLDAQDTLIHLVRDPFENLVSWTFSYLYRKNKPLDTSKAAELASAFIQGSNGTLVKHIKNYRGNEDYCKTHGSKKILIQLEDALEDPEYLINLLRTVLDVSDEAAEDFRTNFNTLKAQMLAVKSGPEDSIRVNTFGDLYYWRNLLTQEDVDKFNALYTE
jgi:hypothetical protein